MTHATPSAAPVKISRRFLLALAITALVSAAVFIALELWDNKYTYPSPQAREGQLIVTGEDLQANPVMFLTDGWALYKGVLLDPETVSDYTPDAYITLGDYQDMSFGNAAGSPHGSATYRMTLDVQGHSGMNIYTLQLPEIYSAYRLYINGELMVEAGNPDAANYTPRIFTGEINFRATSKVDILIAVSDWSHYNSGIVYPLAFGDTLAVNTMVQGRLIWCAGICGAVLMLAIVILMGGGTLRRKSSILFFLLALCFIGYTGYVIIHALIAAGMFWYRFETFCYYAMFFLAIWLIGDLCGIHTRLSIAVKITDAAMCVLCIAIPEFFSGHHAPMYIFHLLSKYYKYFLLLYLTGSVWKAMRREELYAPFILLGLVIFYVSAIVGLFFPHRDPITFGSSVELGCFAMLCILGWAMTYAAKLHIRRHIKMIHAPASYH